MNNITQCRSVISNIMQNAPTKIRHRLNEVIGSIDLILLAQEMGLSAEGEMKRFLEKALTAMQAIDQANP